MNIKQLYETIDLRKVNQVGEDNEIEDVYIGDLLSFVMANGKEGALWLTVQRHMNVIAVAQLNDFSGIVFVEDVDPDEDTIEKATELDIPLFISEDDAFTLSRKLIEAGL